MKQPGPEGKGVHGRLAEALKEIGRRKKGQGIESFDVTVGTTFISRWPGPMAGRRSLGGVRRIDRVSVHGKGKAARDGSEAWWEDPESSGEAGRRTVTFTPGERLK